MSESGSRLRRRPGDDEPRVPVPVTGDRTAGTVDPTRVVIPTWVDRRRSGPDREEFAGVVPRRIEPSSRIMPDLDDAIIQPRVYANETEELDDCREWPGGYLARQAVLILRSLPPHIREQIRTDYERVYDTGQGPNKLLEIAEGTLRALVARARELEGRDPSTLSEDERELVRSRGQLEQALRQAEHTLSIYQRVASVPSRHHYTGSPVLGARSGEMQELLDSATPEVSAFADAIYQPRFVRLIPSEQYDAAEQVARRMFSRYIDRYRAQGVTEDNVVAWNDFDMTRTFTDDPSDRQLWSVQPTVGRQPRPNPEGLLIPASIGAYHEVMHVEETAPGTPRRVVESGDRLYELMPTIATIVRVDEVYREVNRIPASQEVDYGQTVTWSGHSVPLGRLANFYRALEQRYGSIGRAVLSEESFEFMRTGQIPELR